jgi:hypothetical protein
MLTEEYNKIIKNNIKGYKALFLLENYLRGKIDEILLNNYRSDYFTPKKYFFNDKKNNVIDIYEKAKKRFNRETKEKSINLNKEKLINFIDFNDIVLIFEKEWNILSKFFPNNWNLNLIKAKLSALEIIRNKIAHNRIIREIEYQEINTVFDYFLRNLDDSTIEQYLPFTLDDKKEKQIKTNIEGLEEILRNITKSVEIKDNFIKILLNTKRILRQKKEFISDSNDLLDNIVESLKKYSNLPRTLGKHTEIQSFVEKNKIKENLKIIIDYLYEKL